MAVRFRVPTRAGVVSKLLARVGKVPKARDVPTDPRERALYLQEKRDRENALKQWKSQGNREIKHGRIVPSSWVEELLYNTETHKVHALLDGVWYTYFSVPEVIFNNWKQGRADCITDDTGLIKKWIIGKTPSVGAYFHVRIKEKYSYVRGRV